MDGTARQAPARSGAGDGRRTVVVDQAPPDLPPAAGSRRPWSAFGPRDAQAIVLIHGTRLTRSQWWPQVRRLSGRYRCIALDLPGHGTRASEPFTIEAAIAGVRDAIDAEAAGGAALVVGLSLGGYVAIDTAEAYPERVSGLVLAGCSAEPVGSVTLPFRGFASLLERLPPPALRALNLAFFRTRYRPAIAEPIVEGGFWSAGGSQAVRMLIGRRYLERLGRLWTRVTVVNGAFDPVFGPSGDTWASSARRGRHVVIGGALHLSNLDRPRTFSRVVEVAAEEAASARPSGT